LSAVASIAPMVVLPEPETPIKTTIIAPKPPAGLG
jgi:hypothetical protein